MKKTINVFALLCLVCLMLFAIVSCDYNTDPQLPEENCEHEWSAWSTTKAAGCETEGLKTRICSICQGTDTEIIRPLGHTFDTSNVCSVCRLELEFTKGLEYGEITVGDKIYYAVTGIGAAKETDIVIPASHAGRNVTAVAPDAFNGNDLITSVFIPDGITYIGENAFYYCISLKSAYVGNTVTGIETKAFYNCTELSAIILGNSVTSIGTDAFANTAYVNEEDNWDDGVLYISNYLLQTNGDVTGEYTVKDGTILIFGSAFSNCSNLTKVNFPDSLKRISNYAFSGCTGLKEIEFPDSLETIGSYAFSGCVGIESVIFSSSIERMDYGVFYGCTSLFEVDLSLLSYYFVSSPSIFENSGVKKATVQREEQLKMLPHQQIEELNCKKGAYTYLGYSYGYALDLSAWSFSNVKTLVVDDDQAVNGGGLYRLSSLENLTMDFEYPLGYYFGEEEFENSALITQVVSGNSYKENYYIPVSLKSITTNKITNDYAFYNCTIETLTIKPSEMLTVSDSALGGAKIGTLNCNNKLWLNHRGGYLFKIDTLNFDGSLEEWFAYRPDKSGLLYYNTYNILINNKVITGELTIPDGVEVILPWQIAALDGRNENDNRITKVTIPESVTSIGADAFALCANLQYNEYGNAYYLGNSKNPCLILIKAKSSDITSCVINEQTKIIYSSAFSGCTSLASVTIPDSVTSIGKYAFYSCDSLTSVIIPDSVTDIGDYAFSGCDSLTSVYITDIAKWCNISFEYSYSNPLYYAHNLYLDGELVTNLVIPDGVTSIGKYAFYSCDSLTSVIIPDSVTDIGDYAFQYCYNLTRVEIPDSVTSIGYEAFHSCISLTSVVIPESVTSIGSSAFDNCYKLVEVINKSTLNITAGDYSYGDVGKYAKEVHQGESKIVNKDKYLFYTYDGVNYLLGYVGTYTDLTLPENYNGENYVIYDYAFYKCDSLTSVTIGNSVTSIGSSAFEYCDSLTSVTIGNGVTSIGDEAFYGCDSLTSVVIGNGVTGIGSYAFSRCTSLTSVTIGKIVTSIGEGAFYDCDSLTNVVIPDSVTSIGDSAFYGCDSLTSVYITDIAKWCNIHFSNSYSNPLYYAHNLYLNGELVTNLVIPEGVTSIGDYAFYDCDSLTSVEIPNSVTSIGYRAFYRCDSLTSVTIGNSVTSIGSYAFEDCYKLVEVINKSTLNITKGSSSYGYGYVGYYAKEVHQGESKIVNKDNYLFYTYSGVNYLLGYVGTDTDLTLPENYNGENYVIHDYAFYNCDSLTGVTIGNGVTSIGSDAFRDCNSLTSVTIGNGVTRIDFSAFRYCSSLTSIKYRGTEEQWNAISKGSSWDYDTGNYTITYNYDGE